MNRNESFDAGCSNANVENAKRGSKRRETKYDVGIFTANIFFFFFFLFFFFFFFCRCGRGGLKTAREIYGTMERLGEIY